MSKATKHILIGTAIASVAYINFVIAAVVDVYMRSNNDFTYYEFKTLFTGTGVALAIIAIFYIIGILSATSISLD